MCLKSILHPLPEQIIRVYQRSVSREQAAPTVCHSSQSQHSGSPSSKTTLCLCAGVMKMGLTEQDVRRTCLTLNILQTLGVRPPPLHWWCDSHFPHPSGCQKKASRAARTVTCLLLPKKKKKDSLLCVGLTPNVDRFSHEPLFTHSVNVHIHEQFTFTRGFWDL